MRRRKCLGAYFARNVSDNTAQVEAVTSQLDRVAGGLYDLCATVVGTQGQRDNARTGNNEGSNTMRRNRPRRTGGSGRGEVAGRGQQGACGGARRLDGSGGGKGNIGTPRQPAAPSLMSGMKETAKPRRRKRSK